MNTRAIRQRLRTRQSLANTHERFDPTFQFRPYKLYTITDTTGTYAISGESASDSVFLTTPDSTNKYQWVFIDSDTGAIVFFYDLKSYMQIDITTGTINVKRGDILSNGSFTFNSDNTIQLTSNTNYCLGFVPIMSSSEDSPEDSPEDETLTDSPTESFITKGKRIIKEGFTSLMGSNKRSSKRSVERYDPLVEPTLEAVRTTESSGYSTTWVYNEVHDLRTLTDNIDTIAELTTVNDNSSAQVTALQNIVSNNQAIYDIEIQYRDDIIKGYQDNWYVSNFVT